MQIRIKIQSITDVITNSSSEIFRIKSTMDTDTFKNIWHDILRIHNYDISEDSYSTSTYTGDYICQNGKWIEIHFSTMCNVDQDAREHLELLFGKDNIYYDYD